MQVDSWHKLRKDQCLITIYSKNKKNQAGVINVVLCTPTLSPGRQEKFEINMAELVLLNN